MRNKNQVNKPKQYILKYMNQLRMQQKKKNNPPLTPQYLKVAR